MLSMQQKDSASGLAVEGRRDVLDDLGDDLLDARVGDGGLLLERVDGPAVGEGLEERGGRHFGGGLRVGGLGGGLSLRRMRKETLRYAFEEGHLKIEDEDEMKCEMRSRARQAGYKMFLRPAVGPC